MFFLKEDTAVDIKLGPFVDKTDGVTYEVGMAAAMDHADTGVRLSKNGGAFADRNEGTEPVYDAFGYYLVKLSTTDTNTPGTLKVIFGAAATCLPCEANFQVVNANVYDSLFGAAAADLLDVNVSTITADAITAASINTGALTADAFAADAIVAATLATGALTADAFAADAIVAATLATGAITADAVAAGAIANTAFAAGAIDAAAIANGAIDAATLANDTITAASIATGALTADAFAADAIIAATLATGAITADAFAADAIVAATLNTGCITADAFAADSIVAATIANGAIDAATFAAGAITATVIADAAIDAATFAAGAIDAAAIAADAITAAKIAANAIDFATFAADCKTGSALNAQIKGIDANMITATSINADAITAAKIAADAVVEITNGNAILNGTAQANVNANVIVLAAAGPSATDDYYNGNLVAIQSGTGTGQARLIVDYTGATKTATVDRAWTTIPIADSVYRIFPFSGILLADTGIAAAVGAATITLAASAPAVTDAFTGHTVYISGGTGVGQARIITAYTDARIATVSPAWTTALGADSIYKVIPVGRVFINAVADDAITAASIATGAFTADAFAADAIVAATLATGAITADAFAADAIVAASIADAAIDAATFAAGAITPAAIATDAIDADALSADALTEIFTKVWTTALTESYAADAAAPTPAQALFMLMSFLFERGVADTTVTCLKLDGSTTAMTFTINHATTPTAITKSG